MPSLSPEAPPRPAAERLARGLELRQRGRWEEAVAEFCAAAELEPQLPEAHYQLGNALKALRRYAEAVPPLRAAAALAPRSAAAWLNLGVACLELGRNDQAVACFQRAVELEPLRPEAHNILGHALLMQGRCADAARRLEEALRLRPGYPAALDNLGRVLKAQGRSDEAVARHRQALIGRPRPETHSNLLYSLNFPDGIPPEEIRAEHARWARLYADPLREEGVLPGAGFAPPRPLRVGYVSPDFVNHAVAFFFEPVLAAHDRSQVHVTCYAEVAVPDGVTRRLRESSDQWRDIAGRSDAEVAARIRADRIDVLVDLAGHTANNRLLVFARRPAPVQISWLGYPNTTGLEAIDHRLTDAICDPPGLTEAWHSERLLRLPGGFCCYRFPEEAPAVAPSPAPASGLVTFGCFNHAAKLTLAVTALWSRLLQAVPGGRLLLRSPGLSDPETAEAMRARFVAHGIAADRIATEGTRLSLRDHLGRYAGVDVALDPFPYNGTTTTCEALGMGVPVVTLAGREHRSRVGASLLTRLGFPEWIAASPEAYLAIARKLALDRPALASLRSGLRERMRASPLCDAPGFTRQLEAAFLSAWREKCGKGSG